MTYNTDMIPRVFSGETQVLASGSVISYRREQIQVNIPSLGLKLVFIQHFAESSNDYGTIIKSDKDDRAIYIYISTSPEYMDWGSDEPFAIGNIDFEDKQTKDRSNKRLELSYYYQVVSSKTKEFMVTYTLYAVKNDV